MKWSHRIMLVFFVGGMLTFAVVSDGSESLLGRAVALSSVFTGLLTLTGFLFTARTFITFKLNEVVYGHADYRKRVEELTADGAYSRELYDPLKEIDGRVGKTCVWVFTTMVCVLAFSIIPRDWSKLEPSLWDYYQQVGPWQSAPPPPWRFSFYQGATVLVFTSIWLVAAEVLFTILSVNNNIRSIITEWEDRYRREKGKEGK